MTYSITTEHAARCAALFLDFDNVLNSNAHINACTARRGIASLESYLAAYAPWSAAVRRVVSDAAAELLEPHRVALVDRVCADVNVSVVVVSSWRRFGDVDDMLRVLRLAGLNAPVIGCVGGVKMSADLRAWGIADWLREHPETTRWAVLDDTARHYACDTIINARLVSPRDGVTVEDCDAVRALLRAEAVS